MYSDSLYTSEKLTPVPTDSICLAQNEGSSYVFIKASLLEITIHVFQSRSFQIDCIGAVPLDEWIIPSMYCPDFQSICWHGYGIIHTLLVSISHGSKLDQTPENLTMILVYFFRLY